MGLLASRWEASYEGHAIVVSRNEVTRGYKIEWDGKEIAHKSVSLIGLGEMQGTVEVQGRVLTVDVSLDVGSECTVKVDGKPLAVTTVK
jgi:hypothetical protein